jgi:hypothetical protein
MAMKNSIIMGIFLDKFYGLIAVSSIIITAAVYMKHHQDLTNKANNSIAFHQSTSSS